MSAAASPAELPDQSQDEGSTIAEYSFLHAPHPRQNWLKWIPIFDNVQEGTGLKVTHPFLMDKNNWMDIMLVQHLLVDHPFSATFGKHGKAWKAFVATLSKVENPDGKLVFGVQGIGDEAAKKYFEELMVFTKKHVSHVPFESGIDDANECNVLLAGLEDLLDIVTGLENVKSATSFQTAAKKNEDRARAEALRNASLGKLTAADKQLIKSLELAEVEPSSAKKRPANNSPSEMFHILGNTSEHLSYRMEIKAQ